jgi:uncharacterized repeat protein (TIGR01451 family)
MRRGIELRTVIGLIGILALAASAQVARSADRTAPAQSAGRVVQSLPLLELQVTGPEEAAVPGNVTFELLVTNTGQSPLANLMIVDSFDPGFEHPTITGNPIKSKLGDLAAGQSRQVAINFRARQPGLLSNKITILLGDRTMASATSSVRVKGAVAAAEPKTRATSVAVAQAPEPSKTAQAAGSDKSAAGDANPMKWPEPQGDKIAEQIQAERAKARRERIARQGAPLVENAGDLKRLDPEAPIWIDPKQKQVVLIGEVCKADYPLEFFATTTYPDRAYESVVVVDAKPSTVHAGLLAVGAVPGHPTQFTPQLVPAAGTEIAIELHWKDAAGKVQTAQAHDWIRNTRTKKALDINWVFAGSRFLVDEKTGVRHYQADDGDFICVLNSPDALLDLPIPSASALEDRLFESFLERLPRSGTPLTLVLKPVLPVKKPAGG